MAEHVQVADADGLRAALQGGGTGPQLRRHPVGRDAELDQGRDVGCGDGALGDAVDDDPGNVGDVQQLLRAQRGGDGGGRVIGVHVERHALASGRGRHRGHDRREPGRPPAPPPGGGAGGWGAPRAAPHPRGGAELAPAELHTGALHHTTPAVPPTPSITFIFWIASPAAPLTRLSIAAITVRRGRRTCSTGATPSATRFRYTTSLRDGRAPWNTCTQGSPR